MNIHEWIEGFVPTNGIVLEAGAWNGDDTLFFSKHLTEGKVYSFEPFPLFYYQTCQRLWKCPNVEVCPLALAEKTQTYTLYLSEISGNYWCSNSILEPKEHLAINPHVKFERTIDVEGINLDEWLAVKKLDRIDMIWLDIQGAEYSVLKAAPNVLARTKYIYTEVSLIELYSSTPLYDEFKAFMKSKGFEVVLEFLPSGNSGDGDVLFHNTAFEI